MRGKAEAFKALLVAAGITPACAGKRMVLAVLDRSIRDHPRVCGEKVSSTSPIKCLKGSPPRMRGKVPQPGVEGCRLGITPAYAGKRVERSRRYARYGDHPRVCGEKVSKSDGDGQVGGSPPRMRGKVICGHHLAHNPGITPAYAGKSPPPARMPGLCRDHPRVCGEKSPAAV